MKYAWLVLSIVAIATFGGGCEPEPETPGEKIEDAGEKMGDAVDDVVDGVKDAADELKE